MLLQNSYNKQTKSVFNDELLKINQNTSEQNNIFSSWMNCLRKLKSNNSSVAQEIVIIKYWKN
jgi:hypothetical protein